MAHIDFQSVFKPKQPTSCNTPGVMYVESAPDRNLAKYIYCYWRLKSLQKLSSPFCYRVVPDGCIDIFFNLDNLADARIMGFSTTYTMFDLNPPFDYLGVRFMPGSFSRIFRVNAAELANRDEDLFCVVPSLAKHLCNHLHVESMFEKLKLILDNYFLHSIRLLDSEVDKRLYNAIQIVLDAHGDIRLLSDIDTGISSRQLRRLFEYYIGDTPKMFSKVVRFQYFIHLQSVNDGRAKPFHEAGYYDQPHFNREFKAFFGLTPGQVIM